MKILFHYIPKNLGDSEYRKSLILPLLCSERELSREKMEQVSYYFSVIINVTALARYQI